MFAASSFTDVINCTMANNLSTQANCGAAIATYLATSPNVTRPYIYNCLAYNNKHVNNFSSITQGNGTLNWTSPLMNLTAQNSAFETTTTSLPWDAASGNIKLLRTAPIVSPKFLVDSSIYGQTDVAADKASVLSDSYSSNFQITALSPCVNAGNVNRTTLNTDLSNKPRIASVVDMGAFNHVDNFTSINNTQIDSEQNHIRAYQIANEIVIKGTTMGQVIQLFNIAGQKLYETTANQGKTIISYSGNGIVLLKTIKYLIMI